MSIEQRRFGFELEVTEGRTRNLVNRLRAAGYLNPDNEGVHDYHCECEWCTYYFRWDLPPDEQEYNESEGYDHYKAYPVKVQYDSSCGAEIITAPIAWGDPRWRKLCATLDDILNREPRIPTDERCSMHVHVEAADLTNKQLGFLGKLVYNNEAALFRLATGDDTNHRGVERDDVDPYHYCMPLSAYTERQLEELFLLDENPRYTVPGSNKYTALNYVPLRRQGTVEFRLWNVVRKAWQMELYVDMSVALTQRAQVGRVRRSKKGKLGSFTRTKNEEQGRRAGDRLLGYAREAVPSAHVLTLTQRFWQQFEGKEWQPSRQALLGAYQAQYEALPRGWHWDRGTSREYDELEDYEVAAPLEEGGNDSTAGGTFSLDDEGDASWEATPSGEEPVLQNVGLVTRACNTTMGDDVAAVEPVVGGTPNPEALQSDSTPLESQPDAEAGEFRCTFVACRQVRAS